MFLRILLSFNLLFLFGVVNAETKTFVYNQRDQLVSITSSTDPNNPITFTYDEAGNRTSKTHNGVLTEYKWSPRQRLVEVSRNGMWLARYQYDYRGLRTVKQIRPVGKSTLQYNYHYDYDGRLIAETNVLGNVAVHYQWANGELVGELRHQRDNYYYHKDALGSIVAVTQPGGTLVARFEYNAFGDVIASQGSHEGLFGFTGFYADDETGLYYAQQRYYDTELGAFISEDPLDGTSQDPVSQHRYLYAKANPTKFIDPDGRCSTTANMFFPSDCERFKEGLTNPEVLEANIQEIKLEGAAVAGVAQAVGNVVVGTVQTAKDIGGTYVEAATGGRLAQGSMLRLRGQVDSTIEFVQHPIDTVEKAVDNHNQRVAALEASGDFEGATKERARFAATGLLSVVGGGATGVALKNRVTRSRPNPSPPPVDSTGFSGTTFENRTGVVMEGGDNKMTVRSFDNPHASFDTGAQHLPQAITKINNRAPINSKFAGGLFPLERFSAELRQKYPNGVTFTNTGFPDFAPYAKVTVKVDDLRGNTTTDFNKANAEAGLTETPEGFTWHHHQDTQTMQLVPSDLHRAVKHTGGVAIIKQRNRLLQ